MSNRCSECGKYSHTKRTCEKWHASQLYKKYGSPYYESLIRNIRKTTPKKTLKAAVASLLEKMKHIEAGPFEFLEKLVDAAAERAEEADAMIFDELELDLSLAEVNALCKKAAEAEASIARAHLSLVEIVAKFDAAGRKA
jgi:hypothetical protein